MQSYSNTKGYAENNPVYSLNVRAGGVRIVCVPDSEYMIHHKEFLPNEDGVVEFADCKMRWDWDYIARNTKVRIKLQVTSDMREDLCKVLNTLRTLLIENKKKQEDRIIELRIQHQADDD